MKYAVLIIFMAMTFVIGPAKGAERFSVKVRPASQTVSIAQLQTFKYGGKLGYYFTIKASVTNAGSENRIFMIDDDCTFASWKLRGKPLEILRGSCRKNVYEKILIVPGKSYSTNMKIWFPKSYAGNELSFNIGFIEIVDYKMVSGPYWSDDIRVSTNRKASRPPNPYNRTIQLIMGKIKHLGEKFHGNFRN